MKKYHLFAILLLLLPATVQATSKTPSQGQLVSNPTTAGVLTCTGTATDPISSTATIGVPYGGTGIATLAANLIPYGNGTSAFQSSSNLQFNGSLLTLTSRILANGSAVGNATQEIYSNVADQYVARFIGTKSDYAGFSVVSNNATGVPFIQLGKNGTTAADFTLIEPSSSQFSMVVGNAAGTTKVWTANSNGNLGVGAMLVPLYQLDVGASITTNNGIRITNTAASALGAPTLDFYNSTGPAFSTARISSWVGSGYTASAFKIQVSDSANVLQDRFFIDVSGNVGIGNTAPAKTLDVTGTIQSSGGYTGSDLTASKPVFTDSNKKLVSGTTGSGAAQTLSYQPGLLTAVNATIGVYAKVSNASTVDNIIGSAVTFSCVANPTITMYECGTSATCAGSPTTIGTVTVTAAGQAFAGTVSNSAITAGDYIGWAMTAGTCASIDVSANSQIHAN